MMRNYLVLVLAAACLVLSSCGRDRTPRGDAGGVDDASMPVDASGADAAVAEDAATECRPRGAECDSASDCCGDLSCITTGFGELFEDGGTMTTSSACG